MKADDTLDAGGEPPAGDEEESAETEESSRRPLMLWLARLDWLWLAVPLGVYLYLVFVGDYYPDADSYYHMGCARLYATEGWLSSFPNVHFLQHIALVPLAWLVGPILSLKLALVLMPFALMVSVYLALRRWGVPLPGIWVALVSTCSPVFLTISLSIKGGALFAILLVWILDALRAGAHRRAGILAWLSAYAYTGAPVLLGVLAVWVAVRRLWDHAWDLAPCLWVAGGLLVGLVINPFWPDHWAHIWAELFSTVRTPLELIPGDFRGAEWMSLSGKDLFRLAGAPIVAWGLVLLRQLARRERVPSRDGFGAVLGMGFLFAAVLWAKFLYQLMQATLLFLPAVAAAMRPWPRRFAVAAVVGGAVVSVVFVSNAREDLHETLDDGARRSRAAGPEDYRAMGEWLPDHTEPGEIVLAPWDDFPGLFYFNTYNHYVVGMNPHFLLRQDERAFNAYYLLYHGRVADPETLLPTFFDDARIIVTRARPRNRGERLLNQRLEQNERFREMESPTPVFRVFRQQG